MQERAIQCEGMEGVSPTKTDRSDCTLRGAQSDARTASFRPSARGGTGPLADQVVTPEHCRAPAHGASINPLASGPDCGTGSEGAKTQPRAWCRSSSTPRARASKTLLPEDQTRSGVGRSRNALSANLADTFPPFPGGPQPAPRLMAVLRPGRPTRDGYLRAAFHPGRQRPLRGTRGRPCDPGPCEGA